MASLPPVPRPSRPSGLLAAGALLGALGAAAARAPEARADLLELKDGRVVEGAVEEAGDAYRVRTRFGEALVPRADVKQRTVGRTVDELVKERLASLAADDAENRARLARWLVELGRADEGRALAEAALDIDAENATAHGVLGHERHGGRWMSPDAAQRAKGLEFHDGRWWTPEEWKNAGEAVRQAAAAADAAAARKERAREVSRLLRLLAAPDAGSRARAKQRLLDLAAETKNDDLKRLVADVEQFVAKADELARASAGGADAMLLGEIRATMSKLKRPIEVFATSLASNIGGAPVKIQLPELEVINVRTMVGLPATVAK